MFGPATTILTLTTTAVGPGLIPQRISLASPSIKAVHMSESLATIPLVEVSLVAVMTVRSITSIDVQVVLIVENSRLISRSLFEFLQ
jgi:hypothetical protein